MSLKFGLVSLDAFWNLVEEEFRKDGGRHIVFQRQLAGYDRHLYKDVWSVFVRAKNDAQIPSLVAKKTPLECMFPHAIVQCLGSFGIQNRHQGEIVGVWYQLHLILNDQMASYDENPEYEVTQGCIKVFEELME
jgi:hypothetical protein